MSKAEQTLRVEPVRVDAPEPRRERSAMLTRFGVLGRLLVAVAFRHVQVLPESVLHVQRLAEQHSIVYVMRYRSLIDYLLVNAVLLREGLPLAVCTTAMRVRSRASRPIGASMVPSS